MINKHFLFKLLFDNQIFNIVIYSFSLMHSLLKTDNFILLTYYLSVIYIIRVLHFEFNVL